MEPIEITLTKTQLRQADTNDGRVLITEKQLKSAWASYSGKQGGRPVVLRPCQYCGIEKGARDMRAHTPECKKRHSAA